MLKKVKKELFFLKMHLLITKGLSDGRIQHIDDEFYKETDKVIFNSIPITFHLKYLKPMTGPGKCYDRSLFMFFCFPDSLLCRGEHLDLTYRFGEGHGGHGWLEMGDYVYDPSSLLRFDKELYYEIYGVTDIRRTNLEEYNKVNGDFYERMTSVKIEDLLPGGKNRHSLLVDIPLSYGIANFNPEFKEKMDEWLEVIQYDEEQIREQRNEDLRKLGIRL